LPDYEKLVTQLETADWQPEHDSLSTDIWDVVIVGAGPAGAIAAYYLSSAGRRVLLIDKHRFPRDKTCGDGLMPDALNCLERADLRHEVEELGLPVSQIALSSPGQVENIVPGKFVTLKRRLLDALLARQAVAASATFIKAEVSRLANQPDNSVVATLRDGRRISARVGLLASGVDIRLADKLKMVSRRRASAFAIRCYVKSKLELDSLVVSFDRSILPGYAWIFPMRSETFNVGCGINFTKKNTPKIDLKDVFATFIKEFPVARRLMEQGEMISEFRGAMLRNDLKGTQPRGPGNILAIGEVIGTTFPLSGEGIGKAMESGELAAKLVNRALDTQDFNILDEIGQKLKTELEPRYYGYKVAQRWLSLVRLNDFMARRAQKSKFLQDGLAGIISETVDPRSVFSVRGVIKSFFS
jgi:geranylgeranyl reductase family protein